MGSDLRCSRAKSKSRQPRRRALTQTIEEANHSIAREINLAFHFVDRFLGNAMHRFPGDGEIAQKFQEAELDYLVRSEAGSRTMAENYVGLPLDF